MAYAYDELQNLVGESVPSPETIFGKDEDGTPRVRLEGDGYDHETRDIILAKCYRNSRPVLVAAHALGFGIYRQPYDRDDPGLVQMFENSDLWEDIGYRLRDGELIDGSSVTLFRPADTSPRFLEDHSTTEELLQFMHFDNRKTQA